MTVRVTFKPTDVRWISNYPDPKDPLFDSRICCFHGETMAKAVARAREWLADKIIGEPQCTESFTVQQMKNMKLVGVYKAI